MLITESGCCGRFGSMIVNYKIDAENLKVPEQCIYKISGRCGICADRCESGALKRDNFDRFICYEICRGNNQRYKGEGEADVCGKCVVSLPCSYKSPVKK